MDNATFTQFKTTPWAHQLAAFERFKNDPYCALFFEQRVGKTSTALIIAAHKFRTKQIDSLLVIAPNGVHRTWTDDAIPEHLPDDVRGCVVLWRSSKMETVRAKQELENLLAYRDGLRILCVNIDSIITKKLRDYLTKFFFRKRVMTVIDESSDVAHHKSLRSKMSIKIGRRSCARMILDGTPLASGVLGIFAQADFLAPSALNYSSFVSFRARYAELEPRDVGEKNRLCPLCFNSPSVRACSRCNGLGYVGRNQIQVVKRFLNLDELQENLKKFSSRVLRSDCHDLPPKLRQKIFASLDPIAQRVYDELRTQFITELKSGGIISAPMVLVRYLRLQQVTSGFLPIERQLIPCPECAGGDESCSRCEGLGVVEDETMLEVEEIGKVNARLNALEEVVAKLSGQIIIWCKFRFDIEKVLGLAKILGKMAVRYDGKTGSDDRAENVRKFQAREVDWFVGNQRSGSRGLDLAAANAVIYYSHDWSLRGRLQSEDRAISLRKHDTVLYIDLMVENSIDEKIVAALRAGKRISDTIIGDHVEDFI